jgi:thiol-disulfide isomerase/thioredoxin
MRFAPVSAFIAVLALSASSLSAKPPVPRPARELSIVEASGKLTLLTSLKGKVVYVQFLFTTCPHCQALSGVLTKLSKELGPQGFQALGVAFDDDVSPTKAASYVRQFGVGFPVGYASRATVQSYLGMTDDDRFVVPQAVIVDRKGVIRAQTDVQGTENLQREDYLRTFLTGLLKEGAAPKAVTAAPAAK